MKKKFILKFANGDEKLFKEGEIRATTNIQDGDPCFLLGEMVHSDKSPYPQMGAVIGLYRFSELKSIMEYQRKYEPARKVVIAPCNYHFAGWEAEK